MGRPLRIHFSGALFHITVRGNNKEVIFKKREDKEKFLQTLQKYKEKFNFILYCYVLMKTHLHLLLEVTQEEPTISKIMQHILTSYALYFNKRYQRVGHLSQGRFHSQLVDKENYLLEVSRYIHLNPVRAKIVKKPEDYVWSSYRYFVGLREEDIADRGFTLRYFNDNLDKAMEGYKKFVEEKIDDGYASFRNKIKEGSIIGNSSFVEKFKNWKK